MKDEGTSLMVKEPINDLRERTMGFAIRMVTMFPARSTSTEAQIIEKQVLRSGTSVGANDRETWPSRSKSEFISIIADRLKAPDKTDYLLELPVTSQILQSDRLSLLRIECNQLIAIFTTIAKKAKSTHS